MTALKTLDILAPFDRAVIAQRPFDDARAVEHALTQADALHRAGPLPKPQRIAILERTAELLDARKETLARQAAHEGGKPFRDSMVEIIRAVNGIKWAVHYLHQMGGREIPMGLTAATTGRLAFTQLEPVGPVVAVSAFNHPMNLIVHQAIPAVAVGAPVIVKPALTTPLSAFALADLLYEAGLPPDWCRVLLLENEDAERLVTDPRVQFFSFIGSSKVGFYLKSKLAPHVECVLEHGGAAPVLVEDDVDLDAVIEPLAKAGFYHAGQVCVSVQRIFAHESLCARLTAALAAAADRLIVGDPLSEATDIGPLITPREVDRVEAWVNEAVAAGAEVRAGGRRLSDTTYAPTVLYNPPQNAKVSTQEIFGPVVCVYPYQDRDEAIRLANALPYAFQAAVFTRNIDVALDTARRLKGSAVMINEHTAFRADWMPFGGFEESGFRMGGIPDTMEDLVRRKLIVIKSPALDA